MSSDLSTGKTIFILAVVVGCFAVLWPKVFYPMLTASVKQSGSPQVVKWRDPGNTHVLSQLCFLIEEQQDSSGLRRLSDEACIEFLRKSCGVTVSEKVAEDFRLSKDKTNLTFCLQQRFDITLDNVLSTEPPPTRTKPYQSQSLPHPHVRPERPSHLHPEAMHPALREKGRTLPHRTIEKQARPGPMPGVRPPMGGGGHMVPPQTKGSGAMGIIMPLYTVGIVIFFVYTIMKVLFKKSDDEEDKIPKLKNFHLDPEYRKYVFAEEYLDSSNASHRDLLKRQERETSKQRRRQDSTSQPDTKIEDEQMDQLRRRLEETEKAMERLMSQMGSVTDKLTAAKITEVLSQAQSQARILKDAAEGGSDEDLTTSEAFTNTLSEDFSLPLALQRHLEELKVKDMYLKGTSAGNFGSPPISPDELDSPNGRHNSIQGSAPLIATNTTLLSSFTKGNDAIPSDKSNQLDGIEIEKNIQNQQIKEEIKEIPVVDFPLHVSSSLKQNLKNDKKQKEDLVLSSDIAQYDAAEGHSDREGSSDASETGADISDLKSFADNGAIEVIGSVPIPLVEEQAVPEVTYSPQFTETVEFDEENVERKSTTVNSDKKQYILHMKSPAVEHGTQTDENKQLSVLNFRTTYLIDKNEQNKGLNIKEVEDKVNEIVLDATLPIDTQLLVKEAQTGSAVTNNIEIDSSEIGSEPCVVTSQVSLAFIGLEHNDIEGPYTLVIPEVRPKDLDNKNVKIFQLPAGKEEGRSADFVEERNKNQNQERSQKDKVQPDVDKSEVMNQHLFLNKEVDPNCSFFCESNNILKQPEKNNEANQENLTASKICNLANLSSLSKEISDNYLGNNNNDNRDVLQCSLKNIEARTEIISNSEYGDRTQQKVKDLPISSSNGKNNDVLCQSLQNKETKQKDSTGTENNTFHQSSFIREEHKEIINKNINISQQFTDEDEKNCSQQLHTLKSTLSQKVSEDLDCTDCEGALLINSNELVCSKTHDDINESNVMCERIIEIPKTISLESFDLTPEILHGLEEPTSEEEFIAIEFTRPQSPVPPVTDNFKMEDRETLSIYNKNMHSIPKIYKDINKEGVQELASTIVEETTKHALQHISSLTPNEISKHKNDALNFLEPSINTMQSENIFVHGNKQEINYPLESNMNFQSNINVKKQPGEVVGSDESGGEKGSIYVATVRCISKISPPGSPLASDINTSFSLENINLTDHCTQPVTPTPSVEDPSLKAENGCKKEPRNSSPDSSTFIDETIREQESIFRRSTFDSHETDMNHKG